MPESSSVNAKDLCIVEFTGDEFTETDSAGGFFAQDQHALFEVVKERYGDNFDFLVFFPDPKLPVEPDYGPFYQPILNEVSGIGQDFLNNRFNWDSDRLQGLVDMNGFTDSMDILLEEFGHRWLAYVSYLDPDRGEVIELSNGDSVNDHWRKELDVGKSPVGDREQLVRRSENLWIKRDVEPSEFRYSDLGLYLMGLKPAADVDSFTFIEGYERLGAAAGGGYEVAGEARELDIQGVIERHGSRDPTPLNSQKHFRAAFAVATRDRSSLETDFLARVDKFRKRCEEAFHHAVESRATINTRLDPREANTITRRGTVTIEFPGPSEVVRSELIRHGLGPINVEVEVGVRSEPAPTYYDNATTYWGDPRMGVLDHLGVEVMNHTGQMQLIGALGEASNASEVQFEWRASALA